MITPREIYTVLEKYYAASNCITVHPFENGETISEVDPESVNDTNRIDLTVFGSPDGTQCLITAVLDNLGKGASRAAIQSMELMLGLESNTNN